MDSISIVLPYTSSDGRRQRICDWVCERWRRLLPDAEILIGESRSADFSRSEACNAAAARATGSILLVTDADVACNLEMITEGIERVRGGDAPWVVAHTVYHALTEPFSDALLGRAPETRFEPPYEGVSATTSEAGVLILTRTTYERAGGYDERFIGWGYEDRAFAAVVNSVVGRYGRVVGDMLHFWHEPGLAMRQPHIAHNERLYHETVAGYGS
jgi:hypothetical protein